MSALKILTVVLLMSMAQAGSKPVGPPPIDTNTIANVNEALTFSRYTDQNNKAVMILVESADATTVSGYNVQTILDSEQDDLFQLIEYKGPEYILASAKAQEKITVKRELLTHPLVSKRNDHIAAGGNYPEHAEETSLKSVFLFPKYSFITPPVSFVATNSKVLLDYEVEVCTVFSRDIKTMEDYAKSYKGIFLCGDYSDRAELLRLIDVDNVESGVGFTDAKSGDDRMPVGEFMVIPNDFETFSKKIDISLTVNGVTKQKSNTSKMILDFKGLIEKTLKEGDSTHWKYKKQNVSLIKDGTIKKGQILLSGTPEGVIYNKPTSVQKIVKGIKWFITLSFFKKSAVQYVLDEYIKDSFKKKTYLQDGDKIQMKGLYLGNSFQEVKDTTK